MRFSVRLFSLLHPPLPPLPGDDEVAAAVDGPGRADEEANRYDRSLPSPFDVDVEKHREDEGEEKNERGRQLDPRLSEGQ